MKLLRLLLSCSFFHSSCYFILLLLLSTPVSSSFPCEFPAIYNFGDSNSDTGGLSASLSGPLPPPYGETFFGMPVGRYSDGRLIIDFIAESLKLPYLSAYLDSVGANYSRGANFATAGSTITPQSDYSPFTLDVQLRQFSQFKPRCQLISSKVGGVFKDLLFNGDYSRALYTIDIGQNELTAGCFSNKSAEEFIPDAINRFRETVKSIYEMGGRSFWIHNTGPLGCLPYAILRVPLTPAEFDSVGCAIPYNKLAQQFNRMLNETVAQLRSELSLAALTYVDLYSAKYSLFSQAKKIGFERTLAACCGVGGGDYNFDVNVGCGGRGVVNGSEVIGKSCKDPSKRIVWDGTHYTEAANKWVFDQISQGAFSHPRIPLSMACKRKSGGKNLVESFCRGCPIADPI